MDVYNKKSTCIVQVSRGLHLRDDSGKLICLTFLCNITPFPLPLASFTNKSASCIFHVSRVVRLKDESVKAIPFSGTFYINKHPMIQSSSLFTFPSLTSPFVFHKIFINSKHYSLSILSSVTKKYYPQGQPLLDNRHPFYRT